MANIRNVSTVEEYNELTKTEGKVIVMKFYANW